MQKPKGMKGIWETLLEAQAAFGLQSLGCKIEVFESGGCQFEINNS